MKCRSVYGIACRLALFIVALSMGNSALAQNKLTVNGRIKIEDGDVAGSRAVVYKNGVKERTITTDLNKFSVEMDLNATYLISFEKNGYVSKKLSFNTAVPAGAPPKEFLPFDFAVSLFKQYDDINIVVFNQPVGIIRYESSVGDFDYDTDYTKSIQSQLQEVLDQVEERKQEEQKKAEELEKQKALDAKELAKAEAANKKQADADAKAATALAEQQRKDQQKRDADAAKAEAERKEQEKRDAEALKKAEREIKAAEEQAARKVEPVKEEEPEPVAKAEPETVPAPEPKKVAPPVERSTTLANTTSEQEDRRSITATSGYEENPVRPASAVQRTEQPEIPEHLRPVTVRNEDLIVEPSKVIKLITYESSGIITEYRKVTHKWGGVFYFKNGTSCSQEIFERETRDDSEPQIAGATRSR